MFFVNAKQQQRNQIASKCWRFMHKTHHTHAFYKQTGVRSFYGTFYTSAISTRTNNRLITDINTAFHLSLVIDDQSQFLLQFYPRKQSFIRCV